MEVKHTKRKIINVLLAVKKRVNILLALVV